MKQKVEEIAEITADDKTRLLEAELDEYRNQIQKLKDELTQFQQPTPPLQEVSPAAIAAEIKGAIFQQQRSRLESEALTASIEALERIVATKQQELENLQREEQLELTRHRVSEGIEQLRSLSDEIEKIGESLLEKFMQAKGIFQEFDQDFRDANPLPTGEGLGWMPRNLINFKLVPIPRLTEREGSFHVEEYFFNLFQLEQNAIQQKLAENLSKMQQRLEVEAEQKKRQIELLRLVEQREVLSAAMANKRQELIYLESDKVKWKHSRRDLDLIDSRINKVSIEIEQLTGQIEEVSQDIARC